MAGCFTSYYVVLQTRVLEAISTRSCFFVYFNVVLVLVLVHFSVWCDRSETRSDMF